MAIIPEMDWRPECGAGDSASLSLLLCVGGFNYVGGRSDFGFGGLAVGGCFLLLDSCPSS